MNIGITSTGGGVGQSILKSLKKSDYRIFALDNFNLAAGLYMVPDRFLMPKINSADFIPFLLSFCKDNEIKVLFPGGDPELKKLSENKDLFKSIGTMIPVSKPDIIKISDNKFLTNNFLFENGFPTIKNYSFITQEILPVILKPRIGGARSKNVIKINSLEDVPHSISLHDYVIQEFIEGDEYTCGTVTLDGIFYGSIVMRRILRDGDTYKAFVEKNEKIESLCKSICQILKPEGAFNIQLKLKDNIPYVFEFNARCSGTTASRSLAGFNEPLMILDYYLKGKIPSFSIKENMTILRYWEEILVKNENIINR